MTAPTDTAAVYLTQFHVNTRNRQALSDLADGGGLHRTLMRLLPPDLGEQARATGGLLFRVDENATGVTILAQTRTPPLVENIPADYAHTAVKNMTGFLSRLTEGTHVHYRIAANPTTQLGTLADRQRVQATRKLKHLPPARTVLTGPKADDWWARRATTNGLTLHSILRTNTPSVHVTHKPGRHRHAITVFEGDATITDADTLRTGVLNGIGRGRSYGAGLLSLAPA
ncbi:type I-E CRISPR-associated protein Cas6/Cse3/CasE [Streptomyces sp. NPDC014733]|uniref:type I-E CRISPR-associated protein Cas6/Cse3/CasE n=1 Tax=Streptomyces sp. NPDC014733 TaxID=3364885 RepID=UPI0036F8EA3A